MKLSFYLCGPRAAVSGFEIPPIDWLPTRCPFRESRSPPRTSARECNRNFHQRAVPGLPVRYAFPFQRRR